MCPSARALWQLHHVLMHCDNRKLPWTESDLRSVLTQSSSGSPGFQAAMFLGPHWRCQGWNLRSLASTVPLIHSLSDGSHFLVAALVYIEHLGDAQSMLVTHHRKKNVSTGISYLLQKCTESAPHGFWRTSHDYLAFHAHLESYRWNLWRKPSSIKSNFHWWWKRSPRQLRGGCCFVSRILESIIWICLPSVLSSSNTLFCPNSVLGRNCKSWLILDVSAISYHLPVWRD